MSARPAKEKTRVGIIESDEDYRRFLATAVEDTEGLAVAFVASAGKKALLSFAHLQPDVFLVSRLLPDMAGADVICRARELWPKAASLLIVPDHHLDPPQCLELLESGARGYLSKSCGAVKLIAAIRAVHAGQEVLCPRLTKTVIDYFRARGLAIGPLTKRERQVLGCSTRGLSQLEAASELGITRATVERHMHNLLRKLNAHCTSAGISSYLNPKLPW
jgi:DNA-binding NarL/FixJ family response regulator